MRWVAVAAVLLLAVQVSAQDARGPISIYGDEDWLAGPANGVRSGSGTEADPYVVSGWRIEQPLLDTRTNDVAIHIENSHVHVVLRDLVIEQAFAIGLELFEASNVRIESATFVNQGIAIAMRDVSIIDIENIAILRSGPDPLASGILIRDASDVALRVIDIRDGQGPGLRLTQAQEVVLEGVTVEGHDHGIIIVSSSDVAMRGVLAGANRGDGITFANSTGIDGRDVRAIGQTMPSSGQSGRGFVAWATAGLLQGAVASKNDGDGARVWDGHLEIRDSAFIDNEGHGLLLAQSDARAVAIEAHGNGGHGMAVYPPGVGIPYARVLSLHSHDNQGAGLFVQGLGGFHLDVARAERNGGAGIDIRGTENITVLRALLGDNVGPGALFVKVVGGQVVGNQALRNDDHGFSFRSSSDVLVRNNTATGNGGSGYFLDGPRLVLRDNRAVGNAGFGIDLQHAAQDTVLEANTMVANGFGNQPTEEREAPAGFAVALLAVLGAVLGRISAPAASGREGPQG